MQGHCEALPRESQRRLIRLQTRVLFVLVDGNREQDWWQKTKKDVRLGEAEIDWTEIGPGWRDIDVVVGEQKTKRPRPPRDPILDVLDARIALQWNALRSEHDLR